MINGNVGHAVGCVRIFLCWQLVLCQSSLLSWLLEDLAYSVTYVQRTILRNPDDYVLKLVVVDADYTTIYEIKRSAVKERKYPSVSESTKLYQAYSMLLLANWENELKIHTIVSLSPTIPYLKALIALGASNVLHCFPFKWISFIASSCIKELINNSK